MTLDAAIRARLIAQSVGNGDPDGSGWFILIGALTDRLASRPQVAISLAGGAPPLPLHAGGSGAQYPQATLYIRGLAHAYEATRAKVAAVRDALDNQLITNNGVTYLTQLLNEPLWIGYDEEHGRPLFTLDLRASRAMS